MALPTSGRVRKHRQRLKQAGLRPVQIWVPDSRRSGFAEECRRQSALLREDPQERELFAWMEAAADSRGWE